MHDKINWRPASEVPKTLGIEVHTFGKRWHCSAKLCVIYRNIESGICLIGGGIYYKAIDSDKSKSMWRVLHYSDDSLNDFETDDEKSEFEVIEWTYTNFD